MSTLESGALADVRSIAEELRSRIDHESHKKAASNLKQVEKVLSKLDELEGKTALSFSNIVVARSFVELIKLIPLILHDLGDSCPRSSVKSYSRWASWIAFELSPHGQQHQN